MNQKIVCVCLRSNSPVGSKEELKSLLSSFEGQRSSQKYNNQNEWKARREVTNFRGRLNRLPDGKVNAGTEFQDHKLNLSKQIV